MLFCINVGNTLALHTHIHTKMFTAVCDNTQQKKHGNNDTKLQINSVNNQTIIAGTSVISDAC